MSKNRTITFEHAISAQNPNQPDWQEHFRVVIEPHDPITVCTIYAQYDPIIKDCWRIVAFGFSHCRGGDVYDQETGCRLALTSALRKIKSEELRAAFWKLYLERFPVEQRVDQAVLQMRMAVRALQAIHDEGVKRKQAIDEETRMKLDAIQEELDVALKSVVVPPEILATFRAIEAKRNELSSEAIQKRAAVLADANVRKNAVDAEFTPKVNAVYAQVETRKADINAEFAGKTEAAQANIEKLTDEIKAEVVQAGQSVKGKHYQAVYTRGRVTWDTAKLDGLMILLPQLKEARKEGQPSVSIRRI